jgi:hypothetical protein
MRDMTRWLEVEAPYGVAPLTSDEQQVWRAVVRTVREAEGFKPLVRPLVTTENLKLGKSAIPSFGLSLAPADGSGTWNVCRWSTAGCRAACLATAGNGRYDTVTRARVWRTKLLGMYPAAFIRALADEIRKLVAKHGEINFRLNILSDLRWEVIAPALFEIEGVNYYDYTKAPPGKRGDTIEGYRLVGSVTENDEIEDIERKVDHYGSAAVVFDVLPGHALPEDYFGTVVIDGDESDDRVNDPWFVIVGLRVKGDGHGDETGFVRKVR